MRVPSTDIKIAAMGVFVLLVAAAGGAGAAAFDARNADKVDGRHAVGPFASNAQAKGKLVATDTRGKFPARFLPKVGDSDRLDGLSSSSFLRSTGKAANSDKLDGLDSSSFARPCAEGAVQGRVAVDGAAVIVSASGPDRPLSFDGTANGWTCKNNELVRVRHYFGNTVGRFEVVFGTSTVNNTTGWTGPTGRAAPQVTATSVSTLVRAEPFAAQCAFNAPPYLLCYTVYTTNLAGTPIDGDFALTIG